MNNPLKHGIHISIKVHRKMNVCVKYSILKVRWNECWTSLDKAKGVVLIFKNKMFGVFISETKVFDFQFRSLFGFLVNHLCSRCKNYEPP